MLAARMMPGADFASSSLMMACRAFDAACLWPGELPYHG